MSKHWLMAIVSLVVWSIVTPTLHADAVTLFVSNSGNDAWSGRFPEPNESKTDGPFASLERARDEIRRMQKQSDTLKNELVTIREATKKPAARPVTPAPPPPQPPVAPAPAASAAASVTSPFKPAPAPAVPVTAPVITAAPNVSVAPAALAAAPKAGLQNQKPPVVPAPSSVPLRDPRFPPAVKDPPVAPSGVTPPAPPQGMMATAIPLKTKNSGTIPWRVLLPE